MCSEWRPQIDERPRDPAGQEPRSRRDQLRDQHGQREHADEAKQAEILLAQERPQELAAGQRGDRVVQPVQRPAEADHECDQREARGQPEQPPAVEPGQPIAGSSPPEPRSEEEQRLPAERIEGPDPVRTGIGGQRDPRVDLDREPQGERGGEHDMRPEPEPGQREGQGGQQHDVERQDVHVGRLELQGQRLDHRHARILQEVGGLGLLGVDRAVQGFDRVRHHRHEHHEQEHVRDVELPQPLADAHAPRSGSPAAPWRARTPCPRCTRR